VSLVQRSGADAGGSGTRYEPTRFTGVFRDKPLTVVLQDSIDNARCLLAGAVPQAIMADGYCRGGSN
jgi:hypothetical protein